MERRVAALEARIADLEEGFGNTPYRLHRAATRMDLRIAKIIERLGTLTDHNLGRT